MKPIKFKVKKDDSIIHNEGFVVINEALAIRKEYIELSDKELQNKIEKDEPFYNRNHLDTIPRVEPILPEWNNDYRKLEDTKLSLEDDVQRSLFGNEYGVVAFNKRYIDFINASGLNIYSLANKLTACVIYTDKIEGLIMPMKTENEYIDIIEKSFKD